MWLKRIFTRMFATRGSVKRVAERPKPPTQPYVLLLNYSQFYAVAEAIQMDYVTLHNSITRNPAHGLEKALVERERHNRDALGQVFTMIEAMQPYPNTFMHRNFKMPMHQADAMTEASCLHSVA
ncbi:hypothetical protein FOM00_27285 [Pseudomonas sp. ST1]|uniref:hypothetical protein n=1 Tax=Pseudomonas sp. ST1 TaxID=2596897 RepID=UPI00117EC6A3|nr:hypothetical protein [Pseudomonas sp. ST1]TSC29689.1 hypothetical protein FOM00_27285 [Pseudomonas sp. ST1]